MSAQKAIQGSEMETREERKSSVFPRQGVIDLSSRQLNHFSPKGNRKDELVDRPGPGMAWRVFFD